jgi:hypothetical protein
MEIEFDTLQAIDIVLRLALRELQIRDSQGRSLQNCTRIL